MSYIDRLNQGSYESPSGQSFTFSYQTVTREINHRIGSFEFPGVNGTLHQDKGVSGEVYPLTMFIHGRDYDVTADQFTQAAKELGAGILIHPRWGRKRVQILSFSQNEDLTAEAGQAVFNIRFQETLENQFPDVSEAIQYQISSVAETFQRSAIANYVNQIVTTGSIDRNALKQNMLGLTALVDETLFPIVNGSQEISATFRGFISDIEDNIDTYTLEPEGFAQSITDAVRIPAQVKGKIDTKFQGFSNLLTGIAGRSLVTPNLETKNALLTDEIVSTSAVVALAESVNFALIGTSDFVRRPDGTLILSVPEVGTGFQTRGESLAAILFLRDQFVNLINILDDGQSFYITETLDRMYIQVIESYAPTADVVTKVIREGLNVAFSLPAERVVILNTDNNIVTKCYELYGNVDDETLDFFIFTNSLNGDEILLLPRGKEIVYYA